MDKYSAVLVIKEIKIKTKYIFSYPSEWAIILKFDYTSVMGWH